MLPLISSDAQLYSPESLASNPATKLMIPKGERSPLGKGGVHVYPLGASGTTPLVTLLASAFTSKLATILKIIVKNVPEVNTQTEVAHLLLAFICVFDVLCVPSELYGMHSYSPMSVNKTSVMLILLVLAPIIASPFFLHWKSMLLGIPSATHDRVMFDPVSTALSIVYDTT